MIKGEENEKILFCAKIFLLIIEIIIVGIIAFIFFGVSKVNAQTQVGADYWAWKDSNNNWNILNNGNTESGANTNQINIGWNNQTGNINGVIYFEAIGMLNNTANIKLELWTEPTQTSSGVITKSCTIENYNLVYKKTRCQINFTIANNNQPYIRAAIKFNTSYLFESITVSGYANVEPNNGATTEDITNQTIQIINNAIQNALNQSQTIINESNILGNRIETIINSATNSIQNSLLHCENTEINITYNEATTKNKYLDTNNQLQNHNEYNVSDYIEIQPGEVILIQTTKTMASPAFCIYDENKTKISCTSWNTQDHTITTPNNAKYIRTSINNNTSVKIKYLTCRNSTDAIIENQNQNTDRMIDKMILFHEADEEEWEEEKGLLQSILSAIGGIFSSSIDDPSNTLNSFNNSIASNGTITSLLLLPVTIYQKVINSINATCVDITLGTLWNTTLTMPCLHIDGIIGNALYGTIDVIISGFFILAIRKRFISIFNNLSSLKTGGNELE